MSPKVWFPSWRIWGDRQKMSPKIVFYPGEWSFRNQHFPGEKPNLGLIFWRFGAKNGSKFLKARATALAFKISKKEMKGK